MKKVSLVLLAVFGIIAASCHRTPGTVSPDLYVLRKKMLDANPAQTGVVKDVMVYGVQRSSKPAPKGEVSRAYAIFFHNCSIKEIVDSVLRADISGRPIELISASMEVTIDNLPLPVPSCDYDGQKKGDTVYLKNGKSVRQVIKMASSD